jgi:hypothetical protein
VREGGKEGGREGEEEYVCVCAGGCGCVSRLVCLSVCLSLTTYTHTFTTHPPPPLPPPHTNTKHKTGAERAIVLGDKSGFRASLARFLRFMVPVACVNALLKYATRELSLGLRERLTAHLQVRDFDLGWSVCCVCVGVCTCVG